MATVFREQVEVGSAGHLRQVALEFVGENPGKERLERIREATADSGSAGIESGLTVRYWPMGVVPPPLFSCKPVTRGSQDGWK